MLAKNVLRVFSLRATCHTCSIGFKSGEDSGSVMNVTLSKIYAYSGFASVSTNRILRLVRFRAYKQAVKMRKRTIVKKEMAKSLINSENTVPVVNIDKLRRYAGSALHGILLPQDKWDRNDFCSERGQI